MTPPANDTRPSRGALWGGGVLWGEGPGGAALMIAAAAMLVAADLLLAAVRPELGLDPPAHIESAGDVRREIARITTAEHEAAWLLLGDSLLVGDVPASEVPDWKAQRVVVRMRELAAPAAGIRFGQVALHGMLPVDMLPVVRELDRQDPRGRTGLLIALNLRYFSPAYVHQSEYTREWLAELAPVPVDGEGRLGFAAWLRHDLRKAAALIAAHAPVYRHRAMFRNPFLDWGVPERVIPSPPEPRLDLFEIEARMLAHYAEPVLLGGYAQARALEEILRRAKRAGRPVLLFTPPLNGAIFDRAVAPARHAENLGLAAKLVHDAADGHAALVHLGCPGFAPEMFADLVHLLPEGSERLASNLLHALGAPMRHAPPDAALCYPEGPNAALLWNLEPGGADGPPWLAALDTPRGLAFTPDGGALVIADTGNHCLRIVENGLRTVRTLAGTPGLAGARDAPSGEALLDRPAHPCFAAGVLFFACGGGERLRALRNGVAVTEHPLRGPAWSDIRQLRARGERLYLLDAGARILEFDTRLRETRVVLDTPEYGGITAFDVTADGHLFFAAASGKMLRGALADPLLDSRFHHLVFENTAEAHVPAEGFYPFSFEDIALGAIEDMHYLPRYQGILVQDLLPAGAAPRELDERVRFHLIHLPSLQVFPWIKTSRAGAYWMWNASAGGHVTQFREGGLALDPASSSWVYLERGRARMLLLEDGLWAAAKVSHGNMREPGEPAANLFGDYTGDYILHNLGPMRALDTRRDPQRRRGPYTGLLIGSSLIGASDLVSHYGFGRALELELQRRLGLGANLRFDLMARPRGGRNFFDAVQEFEHFVALGGRADVLLLEALSLKARGEAAADPVPYFDRLALAAERHDTQVVFLNLFPLGTMRREGPVPLEPARKEVLDAIRDAGFPLVEVSNALLRATLHAGPVGVPPYEGHHPSPWAIDETARLFTDRLTPLFEARLRGRAAAVFHAIAREETPEDALRLVFEQEEAALADAKLPSFPEAAVRRRVDGRALTFLVDLNRIPGSIRPSAEAEFEALALAILRGAAGKDVAGRLATSAEVTFAIFDNYDEYGEGLRETARAVHRFEGGAEALEALIQRVLDQDAAAG